MPEQLTNAGIKAATDRVKAFLGDAGMERKSKSNMYISIEEILLKFQDKFGAEHGFELTCGKKLRRNVIALSVPGAAFNPLEGDDSEYAILSSLMASSSLVPAYSYTTAGGGVNQITFYPPRQKRSPAINMVLAIIAAITFGMLGRLLPADTLAFIVSRLLTPLFDTFMGVLSAVAGPLIFLSVAWGIYSIGDTAMLGRIGKKMIGRFLLFTFALLALTAICVLPFFPIAFSQSEMDATGFLSIYEMVLDIVPDNILAPLLDGNPLQIIFVASVVGFSMLILNKKATVAAQLVEQLNYTIQLIMEFISALVPVFIFVSLTQMILSDQMSAMLQSYKLLLLVVGAYLLLLLVCTIVVCGKQKISPVRFLKKLMPTFLIAITTSSSSAAFATNVECCKKKLGVDHKIVNFGVPLGQIVYMPGLAALLFIVSLCMAQVYQVAISPAWIITAFIVSGLLAFAAPPIPGGALTCYTIIFLQLGIPLDAVPIVISLNLIPEFLGTATNLFCLQSELVLFADKLGMLDKSVLRG